MGGLRAELAIGSPGACPVAETATTAETTVRDVTWSGSPTNQSGDCSGVTEQFSIDDANPAVPEGVESVFEDEESGVYEISRTLDDCVCERIHDIGHPVSDVRADDRGLHVTLHLPDGGALRAIVEDLRTAFDDVEIEAIARNGAETGELDEIVPVDRGRLTERQLEVLETAHAMGYFTYPREANATEVAETLDICPSTLAEHLAAAQSKVVGEVLGQRER
jgi:hypothetical protein